MKKTAIKINVDCGNSPKKHFLKELNEAYALGNVDYILEHASEDIVWNIHGDNKISGKQNFKEMLMKMGQYFTQEMTVDRIITHGKEAACSGIMKMGDEYYAFCDLYHFKSAGSQIVNSMETYVVKVNNQV